MAIAFLFLLSISLRVELLNHMTTLFNCVRNCQILPKLHHFVLPSAECKDFNCPTTSQLLIIFLILAILVGAEWYLVVVLSPLNFFPMCFLCIYILLPSMQYVLTCWLDSIECVTKAVGFVVFHDLFQQVSSRHLWWMHILFPVGECGSLPSVHRTWLPWDWGRL